MIQSETERQFYLGMAGIHLWYAREALPGAASSPDYVVLEAAGGPESSEVAFKYSDVLPNGEAQRPPAVNGDIGNAPGKPNLKALMEDSSVVRTKPEPVSEPNTSDTSGGEDRASDAGTGPVIIDVREPVKLSVQVWVGRRSAMIARLSSEVSFALQETLALNILRSLDETETHTQGPIHWPVFNNRLVPGNSWEDLGLVLSHTISELEGQRLFVIGVGDDIVSCALAAGGAQGNRQKVSFPHSLSEMAANPLLKRELWYQIKPMAV